LPTFWRIWAAPVGISGSWNGGTLVPYNAIFSGDIPWNLGLI
jgi:hypothetical protein